MNFSYLDTQALATVSKDIDILVDDYVHEINALFKRIYEVPTVSKEWCGNSSIKYANACLLEKNDFLELSDNLKDFSKIIMDFANSSESTIHNNLVSERDF